jgi:hypothetical protein
MPINVTAHDTRLEGRTPLSTSGSISIEVSEETPIQDFFDHLLTISREHSGIGTLSIMAHGVRYTMGTPNVGDDSTGIQFCNPPISYQNIHLFHQLRDSVDRIVLHVCHAAEETMTTHGDGDELCRQMAVEAQAEVTAARENQIYATHTRGIIFTEEAPIEFGEWEGSVVVYDRNGNLIAEFNNPSGWSDLDGVLHDPRVDPEPPSTFRDGIGARHATAGRRTRR